MLATLLCAAMTVIGFILGQVMAGDISAARPIYRVPTALDLQRVSCSQSGYSLG